MLCRGNDTIDPVTTIECLVAMSKASMRRATSAGLTTKRSASRRSRNWKMLAASSCSIGEIGSGDYHRVPAQTPAFDDVVEQGSRLLVPLKNS